MRIAFIGLGSMGVPMAQNLLNAGYELVLYNRTAEKAKALAGQGAKLAGTPGEAACACDIVLTMLSDDAAVEQVTFGEDGLLNSMKDGAVHVSSSTISVAMSAKLSEAHANRGQHFVSATVIGRPEAAKAALLRIILAGPPEARRRVVPVMQALGQEVFEIGDESKLGNTVKLGVNFLIASMIESLGEAQAFVKRNGVEPAAFMEVVNAFFQSPVYKNYGSIMTERRFDPAGFKLGLGLKDIGLVLQAAQNAGAAMPLGELLRTDFEQEVARGHGDLDWTAISLNYIDTDEE